MKILSRKQQIECIKRLNSIRIITDIMNKKDYGEEVKKWAENVEYLANNIIEIANKEDTNLKDTIREIHDNVAQEMYCKGVDDLCNEISTYRMYDEYGNVIDLLEIAEQLKAGDKE